MGRSSKSIQKKSYLIPNLVSIVKGYAKHEKETRTLVIEARAQETKVNLTVDLLSPDKLKKFSQAQAGLSSALSKLMVVVEKYPELKASQNFRDLQHQLEGTENRITVSRNRFIQKIKAFNNLVTVPPESWYNSFFLKHKKRPQFSVENIDEVKRPPSIKF
jgi:LemA protein